MLPVVTVAEMVALDAAALEHTSHDVLVSRAGHKVAEAVLRRVGDVSDLRIAVLVGKGSNGADGRVAAEVLAASGAVVEIRDASECLDLIDADVVIDAAYGTGLSRPFTAPLSSDRSFVVAVDLPSGLDGETGEVRGQAMGADITVTMVALTPGMLFGEGPQLCGAIEVADIGISTATARMALLDDGDLSLLPARARTDHKWRRAVTLVAGGTGMEGAGALAALGALRAGAGMARLVHPVEGPASMAWPLELVRLATTPSDVAETALAEAARSGAMIIGPGLGTTSTIASQVHRLVTERPCPLVLDADGLSAFDSLDGLAEAIGNGPPVILTPHEGELARLLGVSTLPDDRIEVVRTTAARTGAVVLLKGPTTTVASPDGTVVFSTAGTPALATAGTGDVLAGVIAALLAAGMTPMLAAGLGSELHGRAGATCRGTLIASDLPGLVGDLLGALRHGS